MESSPEMTSSGRRPEMPSGSARPGSKSGAFALGFVFSIKPRFGSARAKGIGKHLPRARIASGRGKTSTNVADLVDTNILVYRFDPRFPEKQARAESLLREGIERDSIRIAHQAILEFVAAVTRVPRGGVALLSIDDARRETEELLHQFTVLYPNEDLLRLALRGQAAYSLNWFDAHMWAYAEHYGLSRLLSEDFQSGRLYGSVLAIDPFGADSTEVAQ
jgi:predicted nucleic acid-binding protein